MESWTILAAIRAVPKTPANVFGVPDDMMEEITHIGESVIEEVELQVQTCDSGWEGLFYAEKPTLESGRNYYMIIGEQFAGEFKVSRVVVSIDGYIKTTFDGCSSLNQALVEAVSYDSEPDPNVNYE